MNFKPLTIHCISLLFDVVHSENFKELTTDDITNFKSDIYFLIEMRIENYEDERYKTPLFINLLTVGVLALIHSWRFREGTNEADWMLTSIDELIDSSLDRVTLSQCEL